MPFFKVTVLISSLCCISLFADWSSDLQDNSNDVMRSLYQFNKNTGYASSGTAPSYGFPLAPFLMGMTYGVEFQYSRQGESLDYTATAQIPSVGYQNALGLKQGFEDNTQNYLDYLRAWNTDANTYGNGYNMDYEDHTSIDNWLNFGHGMDIMNLEKNKTFHIPYPDESYTSSGNQEYVIKDRSDKINYEADRMNDWGAFRVKQTAFNQLSGSNFTGEILDIGFMWLHDLIYNMSMHLLRAQYGWDIAWMREKRLVFTLRPEQGNPLYPLWSAWNSKRTYIDLFTALVCYMGVICFILSRFYLIVTK